MSKRECPDYEETVSLNLPPGTTLEELGDMIMQAEPEYLQDSAEPVDTSEDSVQES